MGCNASDDGDDQFEVFHPEVLQNTHKHYTSVINKFYSYTMVYMSGRHVSTYSIILRPSKKTDPRVVLSWVCFLGGPEDDRLGRNMSP